MRIIVYFTIVLMLVMCTTMVLLRHQVVAVYIGEESIATEAEQLMWLIAVS